MLALGVHSVAIGGRGEKEERLILYFAFISYFSGPGLRQERGGRKGGRKI